MAGIGYQLLHSDAFSAELEALGLGSSLFGAAGIPAPIFQALVPRRAGVFDANANTFGTVDEPATYTRASDGIYLDADGNYQIAADNAIRAEYDANGAFLGYLFEPAITNKCTNYNANPDAGLTNCAKIGDAASVMTRELAVAALATAGLSAVCSTGYVLRLDNSAGSGAAALQFTGATGNTNDHTVSGWVRKISGAGQADVRLNDNSGIQAFTNTAFERVSVTATPTGGTVASRLHLAAGVTAEIILNQFEELAVVTSPIITTGTTATRAIDSPLWSGAPGSWSEDAGTLVVDVYVRWPSGASGKLPTNFGFVTVNNNTLGLLYSGAGYNFKTYDGTTSSTLAISQRPGAHRVCIRWNGSTGKKQIADYNSVLGWRANAEEAYAGAWTYGGAVDRIEIAKSNGGPYNLKNLRLYNRDITHAEQQRLFTP